MKQFFDDCYDFSECWSTQEFIAWEQQAANIVLLEFNKINIEVERKLTAEEKLIEYRRSVRKMLGQ